MAYKYSNKDYMAKKVSHREYYGQFVTDTVKMFVEAQIGTAAIIASKDEYFNDIPLRKWDDAAHAAPPAFFKDLADSNRPTNANGVASISLAEKVCLLKEAARQLADK